MPTLCPCCTSQVEELREWKAGEKGRTGGGEGSDEDASSPEVDRLTVCRQILELLKPGETVLKVRAHNNNLL